MTPSEYQEAPDIALLADKLTEAIWKARVPPEVETAVAEIQHEAIERRALIVHGIGVRIHASQQKIGEVWQATLQASGIPPTSLQSLPPVYAQIQPQIQQAAQWLISMIMQAQSPTALAPIISAYAQQQPHIAPYVLHLVGCSLGQIQQGWSAKWQDVLKAVDTVEMRLRAQVKHILHPPDEE